MGNYILSIIRKTSNNDSSDIITYNQVKNLDLNKFPPEICFEILKNLNATDLCLAACVWRNIAYSDVLWRKLCLFKWPFIEKYDLQINNNQISSFFKLYLILDESTLLFNYNCFDGIAHLKKNKIITNDKALVDFLFHSKDLSKDQLWCFLESNFQHLRQFIKQINYTRIYFPLGLKETFQRISSPGLNMTYKTLELIITSFAEKYLLDNPETGHTLDELFLLSFSLIVLYEDLNCPHVKNKMSKREFIKNTKNAVRSIDSEFLGLVYDEIYTEGLVPSSIKRKRNDLPVFNPTTVPLDMINAS